MNITDIQEGKTFYQIRITRDGTIYQLDKVNINAIININAIRGNIESVFQIIYTIPNSDIISYKNQYQRLYVEESNSPYFIRMGGEQYLTLPNKQALMKAVKAQLMTTYTPNMRLFPIISHNYKESIRIIKQLH